MNMSAPKGNKNALGNKGGRPSEYDPAFIEKVDEYLETRQDKMFRNRIQVSLPTLEGFAGFIHVKHGTLLDWEKKHIEFSEALDKIRTEQHRRLVDSGLAGTYNSTIAKLILSSNHGMKEQTENTIKASPEDRELINNALYGFINPGDS